MKRIIIAKEVTTYQNRRNPNKFIEVKKENDGHNAMRQYMKWDTEDGEVQNYTGAKDAKRGRFSRARKGTIDQTLEDYDEVVMSTELNEDTWEASKANVLEKRGIAYEDDIWNLVGDIEQNVNDALKIYVEPSTQGQAGYFYIFDESGDARFDAIKLSARIWFNTEKKILAESKSQSEFELRYSNWVQEILKNYTEM